MVEYRFINSGGRTSTLIEWVLEWEIWVDSRAVDITRIGFKTRASKFKEVFIGCALGLRLYALDAEKLCGESNFLFITSIFLTIWTKLVSEEGIIFLLSNTELAPNEWC